MTLAGVILTPVRVCGRQGWCLIWTEHPGEVRKRHEAPVGVPLLHSTFGVCPSTVVMAAARPYEPFKLNGISCYLKRCSCW